MLSRYYDFILESKIQLLLEGKLIVSKGFKETLKKMRDIISVDGEWEEDTPIHILLLDFIKDEEETEEPLSQNYLDIVQDKDDTITFMSDKNFDRLESPPEKKKEIFLLKGRSEIKIGRFIKSFLTTSGWKGSKYISKVEVKLESGGNFRLYPYVDTMRFYDGIDTLSNFGFPHRCLALNDTDGRYESWDEYEDHDSWDTI